MWRSADLDCPSATRTGMQTHLLMFFRSGSGKDPADVREAKKDVQKGSTLVIAGLSCTPSRHFAPLAGDRCSALIIHCTEVSLPLGGQCNEAQLPWSEQKRPRDRGGRPHPVVAPSNCWGRGCSTRMAIQHLGQIRYCLQYDTQCH